MLNRQRPRRARPKTAQHLGTGFLVAEKEQAFLVTAAHAARRMHRAAHLSFAGAEETVRQVEIARLTSRPWGCSGAPVFVVPQLEISLAGTPAVVEPRCVGPVSQTISDESGAQYAAVAPGGSIRRTLARAAD